MKNDIFLVEESLNEFAKRGRKPKTRLRNIEGGDTDKWGDDEEDAELTGPEEIEDIEIEDEVGNPNLDVAKMLNHELQVPEFSRAFIKFKVLGTGEKVRGVPMAKMGGGTAYLFKTASGLKKVKLTDMIMESLNEEIHPFTEYIFEVADIIKTEVPDWQEILASINEEYDDVVTWLETDKVGFDLLNRDIPAEEAAMEAIQYLESIQYEESENEFDE
jgi:hypothetical protein